MNPLNEEERNEKEKREEEEKKKEAINEIRKQYKNIIIGKSIGSGGYGDVYEVKYDGRNYAGKITLNDNNYEKNFTSSFKGRYLLSTIKNIEVIKGYESYLFSIMKEASLSDLIHNENNLKNNSIFKLIIDFPFEGILSDNLLKFYSYQIIKGLESLERADYFHFDIKPDNILILDKLLLQIGDFGLLRNLEKIKIKDSEMTYIPGGTNGYSSPEIFQNGYELPIEVTRKQDCFAFGATLFFLKFGKMMIKYFKKSYPDMKMTADFIIDSIQRGKDIIKSKKYIDKDSIDFLDMLINYKPEEREFFREMIGNKWLNKNLKEILEIHSKNCNDNIKDMIELNKSDFLINKQKERKGKTRKKFTFRKRK